MMKMLRWWLKNHKDKIEMNQTRSSKGQHVKVRACAYTEQSDKYFIIIIHKASKFFRNQFQG